jgi:ABC-type bacteriocin/lantibiotic exporter with double-glycine peptidase domain
MNLKKINDNLTKIMISTFLGVMILSFVSVVLPMFLYSLVFLLYVLMIITFLNFALSTYLMIQQINEMIEEFFKQYEQQHN